MTALPLAAVTFFSTLLGGLFALRFRDRLHLILGFTAGVRLGAAFFDLLPESVDLGEKNDVAILAVMSAAVFGFLVYHMLEKTVLLHGSSGQPHLDEGNPHAGVLGAGGFSLHSFFDGVAIGLSFQASTAVGIVVSAAVIGHDFSDGLNTVSILLKNRASESTSFRWLFVDATTPFMGALSTLLFRVPESWLALILAAFAGFFLYVGAGDLMPEAHHRHHSLVPMVLTVAGVAFMYLVTITLG
ncbi:MAG: ZIP family metal transporter [Rudaea sp.]